jgi:hypothetical protein
MRASSGRSVQRRPRAKQRSYLALAAPPSDLLAFAALRSSLASHRPGFVRMRCEEQNQPDRAVKGKNNVSRGQQQVQRKP